MSLSPRWNSAISAWADWLRAAGRPDTTVYQRTYQIRRLARDHPKGPGSLTTAHLAHWLAGQNWGPETRSSFRAAVTTFYAWAHAAGHVEHNPAGRLPTVRLPRARPRPASDTVYRAALRRSDERVGLMLRLARLAGLRRDEISRVHGDDLIDQPAGASLRVVGKGGHVRIVPLVDELATRLRALNGWAFPGVDGHLSRYQVGRLMRRALDGRATPHQLRHAFATAVHRQTGDLRVVQELLGHASVATTQRYVLVDQDDLRAAVEAAAA